MKESTTAAQTIRPLLQVTATELLGEEPKGQQDQPRPQRRQKIRQDRNMAVLAAEVRRSVKKARSRFVAEHVVCMRFRSTLLPLLHEIEKYAIQTSWCPCLSSGSRDLVGSVTQRPSVFDEGVDLVGGCGISHFHTLLRGRLPQTEAELRLLQDQLQNTHVQTSLGLVWSYDEYRSYSGYDSEVTCGVEVEVICPDRVIVNEQEMTVSALSELELAKALNESFYSPKKVYRHTTYVLERDETKDRSLRQSIGGIWHLLWAAPHKEITFLDPFWKRLWYGVSASGSADE